MISRRSALAGMGGLSLSACVPSKVVSTPASADPGLSVEVFAPELRDVIDPSAYFETLSVGYQWSEGPTWDRERETLYFTDVPQNKAFQWRPNEAVKVFLDPSGSAETEGFREPGANGLWYAADGSLLICNHGHRAVERMDLSTGQVRPLVTTYNGAAFNSPNDLVQARDGTIYFTDPPYGLDGLDASPLKQQDANGVYRVDVDGTVTRIVSDMTFPNGIALSPGEDVYYVSQSDPKAPHVRAFALGSNGEAISERIIFDASPFMRDDAPGLPDGMAICVTGEIFVTGPGGVFVLSADGTPLGRLRTGRATANCAFGEDGRSLFITASDRLLKVRAKVPGVQWS